MTGHVMTENKILGFWLAVACAAAVGRSHALLVDCRARDEIGKIAHKGE
jgi:hypothetical protein